jgi:hypothetical protein
MMPSFQKRLLGAVGRAGVNIPNDVRTVKSLLNDVPDAQGGPVGILLESTPMVVLISQIERFQAKQLGRADGRVDPGGRTFQALLAFDRSPGEPAFVPTTSSGKKNTGKKAT